MIVGGAGKLIVIERARVTTCPAVSATWTVNGNVPVAVGVPEITPVVGFIPRGGGSVPVPGTTMLHVSGPVPPVASTGWL